MYSEFEACLWLSYICPQTSNRNQTLDQNSSTCSPACVKLKHVCGSTTSPQFVYQKVEACLWLYNISPHNFKSKSDIELREQVGSSLPPFDVWSSSPKRNSQHHQNGWTSLLRGGYRYRNILCPSKKGQTPKKKSNPMHCPELLRSNIYKFTWSE